MVYKWKYSVFSADANKVGAELEQLREITNVSVLEKAKDKNTELHKCFEWNNDIAGEKYRLVQANQIIGSISIVINEDTEQEKAIKKYVKIKVNEDKSVFKSIVEVVENDEEYQQVIKKAETEFISYKNKYEELLDLKDLKDIIFRNMK